LFALLAVPFLAKICTFSTSSTLYTTLDLSPAGIVSIKKFF